MRSESDSAPEESSSDVEVGWRALDEGRWDDAARHFSRVLDDHEDRRAMEGLAWSAWWRSEGGTLFAARQRAFHLSLAADDVTSAARAAIWLGSDHHEFRGEHAVARGWRERARRLLQDVPNRPEHGWLAFHDGAYALEIWDDTDTAIESAARAAAVGRSLGVTDLEFLGLALQGLALVTAGEVDEGMRCLDEAAVAATSGEIRERVATVWTLCYLVYACERVRDFDRAAQWCRRMEEVSADFAFESGAGLCRAHYGGVLLLHGKWDDAERELRRAQETLIRTRPPGAAEAEARLGELRRRQGRSEEATDHFARAEPHPLAVLGMANLNLDRGAPERALELAEDLLDTIPESSVTERADALEVLTCARAAVGDVDGALESSEMLARIAASVKTVPLQAMSAGSQGVAAEAGGDDLEARRCFETAVEAFDRCGLPYEAAVWRMSLARTLGRMGRDDAAARQAAKASQRLDQLGGVLAAGRASPHTTGRAENTVPGLTPREVEVLAVLAEGFTDREIAERLSISVHTVHRHVSNILTKLNLPSRTAAVAHAARHGLLG